MGPLRAAFSEASAIAAGSISTPRMRPAPPRPTHRPIVPVPQQMSDRTRASAWTHTQKGPRCELCLHPNTQYSVGAYQ